MYASKFRFYPVVTVVFLAIFSCGNPESGNDGKGTSEDSLSTTTQGLEDKRNKITDESQAYAELDGLSALHKMEGVGIFRSVIDSSVALKRIVAQKKPIYIFVPSDELISSASGPMQKALQDSTSKVLEKLLGYSHIYYPTDQNTDTERVIRSLTGKDLSMVKSGNEWIINSIQINGNPIKTKNAIIYRVGQLLN
jgi:uncharacterized surface protein with fasciclin (FAS1) repeats